MAYTQEELSEAFDKVKSKVHWKDRINALIEPVDERIVSAAVIHFTGTVPYFRPVKGGKLRCRAVGYRMGPCGDY